MKAKFNQEALSKIKSLVDDIHVSMMVTNLGTKPLSTVPMSTKKVDPEGNIWFLSAADSDHNNDIEKDPDVHLIYSKPTGMEFLSLYGRAEITVDQGIIEDLYSKEDDNWFNGTIDKRLTAIKFSPENAYFWNAGDNQFVALNDK